MATLTLKALHCNQTEDLGADEPYLLVDGVKVWNGSLNNGQHKDWVKDGNPLTISFNGAVEIKLMEDDGNHWYDRNDHLGTTRITDQDVIGGRPIHFGLDGASYDLYFEVTA